MIAMRERRFAAKPVDGQVWTGGAGIRAPGPIYNCYKPQSQLKNRGLAFFRVFLDLFTLASICIR